MKLSTVSFALIAEEPRMNIENTLDRIHEKLTGNRWLQLFTAFTRCLLGIGFIPPSIPKILHKPFTILPDSNPVGHYFNALYDTGFYYEFIGWSQLIAACLLLIPRTSHLGALMFLPIIANIAVLTCSVGFKGTWLITIFMGLAATYLVSWEYDRLKPIIFFDRDQKPQVLTTQWALIPLLFAIAGIGMAMVWKLIRLGNFASYTRVGMILATTGFVFGLLVALHYRFMPVGKLDRSSENIY